MKKSILVLPLLFLLNACAPNVPKCGDPETIDLVKEIAFDVLENNLLLQLLGAGGENNFSFELKYIRTTSEDPETGAFECAADMEIYANSKFLNEIPITYTVELTDDGENFYVNVYGL